MDAVILDMVLPGMNGRQTLRALRECRKDLPVLLVSGYSLEGEARAVLAEGASGWLGKPFALEELERKLGELRVQVNWCR